MSDLQRQKNEKIELKPNQRSPREAVATDFVIGSVARTDEERKHALKDSDVDRAFL
jgi:hypothetical protein